MSACEPVERAARLAQCPGSRAAPTEGTPRPLLLACPQDLLGLAVGDVVAVLDGDDRDDLLRAFELLGVDVGETDVADLLLLRSSASAPTESSIGTFGSTACSW